MSDTPSLRVSSLTRTPAAAPYLVQDQGAPLLREEVLVVVHDRSTSFRVPRACRSTRHRLRHVPHTRCEPAANPLDKDIPPATGPADVPYSHGPVLVAPLPVTTRTCHSGNTGSPLSRGSGRFRVERCTEPAGRRSSVPRGILRTGPGRPRGTGTYEQRGKCEQWSMHRNGPRRPGRTARQSHPRDRADRAGRHRPRPGTAGPRRRRRHARRRCSTIRGPSASPATTRPPSSGAPTTPRPRTRPERLPDGAPVREAYCLVQPHLRQRHARPVAAAAAVHGGQPRPLDAPHRRGSRPRTVRLYGLLVRLAGLTLTVLLVAAACEVALDLTAWQCAGTRACAEARSWLGFLSPTESGGGWWSAAGPPPRPGRRGARRAHRPAVVPVPPHLERVRVPAAAGPRRPSPPTRPCRTGAGPARVLVRTPAGRPAARRAHRGRLADGRRRRRRRRRPPRPDARRPACPGGPGRLLVRARSSPAAVAVVWVVCRRGRSESRLDTAARRAGSSASCPGGALALLLLTRRVRRLVAPRLGVRGPAARRHDLRRPRARPGPRSSSPSPCVAHLLYRAAPRPAHRPARPRRPRRRDARLRAGRRDVRRGRPARRRLAGRPAPRHGRHHRGPARPADLAGLRHPGRPAGRPAGARRLAGPADRCSCAAPSWTPSIERTTRRYPGARRTPHAPAASRASRAMAALTDRAPRIVGITSAATLLLGAAALVGRLAHRTRRRARPRDGASGRRRRRRRDRPGARLLADRLRLHTVRHLGPPRLPDASARRTIGILWDVGTFWPRAAHPFAPPCYAERAVPDLTWRMATWTEAHRRPARHLRPLPGQRPRRGRRLAAAARPARRRVALLTYGSPLERLYGRWFPAYFGPRRARRAAPRGGLLAQPVAAHRPDRRPRRDLPGDCGPEVDRGPLQGPARLRPHRASTRCPRRSSATPTTRPTRPSPRSATRCWRLGPVRAPARRVPGPRPEGGAQGSSGQVLRVEQGQVVRARLGELGDPARVPLDHRLERLPRRAAVAEGGPLGDRREVLQQRLGGALGRAGTRAPRPAAPTIRSSSSGA